MGTTDNLRARYCLTLDLDVETASYICTALDIADRAPGKTKRDHGEVVRYSATLSRIQRMLRESIAEALRSEAEGGGND